MWFDEKCSISNFLSQLSLFREAAEPSVEYEGEPIVQRTLKIPKELEQLSAESLASEYLAWSESEFPGSEPSQYNLDLFIESKYQVDRWSLSGEVRLKIEKAKILIEQKNEQDRKRQQQNEKQELPSLVSRCVDWAISNNLKKLTVADVDAFMIENDLDVLPETKRAIYATANVQMKMKK